MKPKKVIIVDNNISNSDWSKAKSFDFPNVATIFEFETLMGVPAVEPDRSKHLRELAKLPWAKFAPKPIRDLLKQYAVPKKKSKMSKTKGVTEGVILFKGVAKARRKPPRVTSADINNLAIRVRQHNAKAKPAQKTNLRDLRTVYLRGLEDGDKTLANKRISKFLSLLMSDKPKDVKYFDDNDLLPLDHPWRNRKTNKKWAGFDDGEYGVKYAEKCCPRVVKRYRPK